MPRIVLTYFDVRGRAEPARLMLEDQGVAYANRFLTIEEWPQVKPTFRFGQVPVLTDGDRTIEESFAIYNYLARKLDLLPKDEDDLIRHDQIGSMVLSASLDLGILFWDPDFATKRADMLENKLPIRLGRLETLFSEGGGPFWMGKNIHYADYQAWCFLDMVRMFDKNILKDFPELFAFKKAMESRPRIRSYLCSDRRPQRYTVKMAPFGGHEDNWRPG